MADYSFLLGAKPIQLPDPVQQMGSVVSLANAARQGQLAQYTLQQAQRNDAKAQALQQALPGLDLTDDNSVRAAMQQHPEAAQGILQAAQDYRKNAAEIAAKKATAQKDTSAAGKNQADTREKDLTAIGGIAGFYRDQAANATPDQLPAILARAQASLKSFGYDPSILNVPDGANPVDVLSGVANGSISAAKQADLANTKTGQAITMRGQDLTAGSAAARTAEMANYHNGRLAQGAAVLQGPDGGLTDDAVTNAAARYNMDGTLPPLGMGKSGASTRQAILNKAAELAAQGGISPDDQRINQLGNKADAAAMQQLSRQENMIGAFEKNFRLNADLALKMSSTVGNGGVPLVNQWLNAGKRAITGDPQLAAYDTAIDSTLKEYSKIVSGSMGNQQLAEGEINKARERLNAAQTPEAVTSVISFMQKETDNRMQAFQQQHAELRNKMRGQPPASPASSGSAPPKPQLGEKRDGYTYRGGDPALPSSWAK